MLRGFLHISGAALAGPLLMWKSAAHMEGDVDQKLNLTKYKEISIIGGSASKKLTGSICRDLGIKPVSTSIRRNDNGEILLEIEDSVNQTEVYVIQTCAAPVNDNFMELLFSVSAAKRAGASGVTAVVPYFGYKHHKRGLPMSTTHHSRFLWSAAGDMGKMLQSVGADKIISVDLQKPGQGHEACFFVGSARLPAETISTIDLFVEHFVANVSLAKSIVVVAPTTEFVKKGLKFQKKFRAALGSDYVVDFAEFLSVDDSAPNSAKTRFIGQVTGSDVIIIQDIIDSAEDLSAICFRLKKEGAKRIFVCASHGNFTAAQLTRISLSPVEKVLISDSIELPTDVACPKVEQIPVGHMLSAIIRADSKMARSGADFIVEEEKDDNIFELEE